MKDILLFERKEAPKLAKDDKEKNLALKVEKALYLIDVSHFGMFYTFILRLISLHIG